MRICPNLSIPEVKERWDAISNDPELGRFEAMREFMQAESDNRSIGTPDEVKAKLARRFEPFSPSVVDLRVQEQAELADAIPNVEKYIVDGKVDKTLITNRKDLAAYNKIYKKYDKLITPLLKTTEGGRTYQTPQQIRVEELSNDPVFADAETLMGNAILTSGANTQSLNTYRNEQTRAIEIVRRLSSSLGVGYQFVTQEEAKEITKSSANPYTEGKGPAFFYGNTVYFVGEYLTPGYAFHEFSHPLIRAIKDQNPLLFKTLHAKVLAQDPTLLTEAISEYQDLRAAVDQETDPIRKAELEAKLSNIVAEEVLVKALTKAAGGVNVPTGFAKVVADVLYAIKQLLRKVFGMKINVAKLDANTTMDTLANMLTAGGNFDINTEESVNNDDVVAYVTERSEYFEDLEKIAQSVGSATLVAMARRMHQGALSQIERLRSNKDYAGLLSLLVDEYNRGDLQEIRSNLSKYTKQIDSKIDTLVEELNATNGEIQAVVNSMLRLELVLQKMEKHLKSLADDPTDQDNVHRTYYYSQMLDYWGNYIKEAEKGLRKGSDNVSSPMLDLLMKMGKTIERANESTNKILRHGVSEVLWEQWQDMAEQAESLFNDQIASMIKRGAKQQTLDNLYTEFYGMPKNMLDKFETLKALKAAGNLYSLEDIEMLESLEKKSFDGLHMTQAKIDRALRGEGKDASWWNSYLEGYLYNTDPVIGGFAKYYKSNMIEAESRSQARYNQIMGDLEPALKEAGITFNNIGELGKMIGFVDTVGYTDKDGEFKTKELWTLLNPHLGHRVKIDTLNHDITKLENEYNKTKSTQVQLQLIEKLNEKRELQNKWFYRKYNDKFYEKNELLEKDELGRLASFQRETILSKITNLQSIINTNDAKNGTDIDDIESITNQLDAYWREYRTLYSLYDINGKKKTGEQLEIAIRLQEHKRDTRKFYESIPMKGVFENALRNFEAKLFQQIKDVEKLQPGSNEFQERYDEERKKWLTKNTRVQIKPEFYAERARLFERIKTLTAKLPKELDFSEDWKNIIDVMSGYRDNHGQPIGTEVNEARRDLVKSSQQRMIDARAKWAGFSGLTVTEMEQLISFSKARKKGEFLSTSDFNKYKALIKKQNTSGLDEYERSELNGLFAELSELQRKEPTEYYLDTVNKMLETVLGDGSEFYTWSGINEITVDNVDMAFSEVGLEILFKTSPDFKDWFEKNHIEKKKFDPQTFSMVPGYERLYTWNVVRPTDPEMYETTEFKNEDGDSEYIPGLPIYSKYYTTVVKKEYRTGYDPATGKVTPIVGLHVDNLGKESWLPKDLPDSPFRNERYYEMKNAPADSKDRKLFKVLQIITEAHLKNQEGLSKRNRLYLDFPRFMMSNLEAAQAKKLSDVKEEMGALRSIFQKIIQFFRGAKDQAGEEFNWKAENQLVRATAFNDEIENIPIQGLFNLDMKETSTDIVESMFRYLWSAETNKQLVKMNPVAKSIKRILNDPESQLKEPDKINRGNFINNGETTYMNKKGKYIRAMAFNNFYEREFEGQTITGVGKDNNTVLALKNGLFKHASFAFFAFNVPSALKNAISAKLQAVIESAARDNITPTNLAKGEGWSLKYMTRLSAGGAYAKGKKDIMSQLVDVFDPVQGRSRETFGKNVTRTLLKDAASFTWPTNFRKWTELQASMQTFAGMMYTKKVSMNNTLIDYIDAWELGSDNAIKLKDGIDIRYNNQSTVFTVEEGDTAESLAAKYNMSVENFNKAIKNKPLKAGQELTIENTEYKKFRNRVHSVMNKLNGAYAKIDQPEAERYLAFKMISYLRRYFTTMALNRFGKRRWNPGYGDIDAGYYRSAVSGLIRMIKNQDINAMTTENKKNWMKIAADLGIVITLMVLPSLLWGWDDDDEDRYEKLRERSGALPLTGVYDDERYPFDTGGFLSLHALNLVFQVRSETEQFVPLPSSFKNQFNSLIDLKSLALGPTAEKYVGLFNDFSGMITGDDRQYYKRRAGAFEWQQPGENKLWNHLGKMIGITGSNVAPADYITSTKQAQQQSLYR